MDRKEIGRKIKKMRTERGMSQYKLAMEAGLSPSYIPDIEKGLKCPTVEALDSICYALHITLQDFFKDPLEIISQDKLSSLNDHQKKLLNDFLNSL